MRIGLTGGIGAGKSTVAAGFARRGAVVIDADAISKEVVEPGGAALDAIVARFGADVLDETGALDRASLADIVFSDPTARAALEGIIHPAVRQEIGRRATEVPPEAIVVVDIPLLDADGARAYDAVVVVESTDDARLARLVERGMDPEGARARMRVQATDDERRAFATYVIDNTGDRSQLEREMDRVWSGLRKAGAPA